MMNLGEYTTNPLKIPKIDICKTLINREIFSGNEKHLVALNHARYTKKYIYSRYRNTQILYGPALNDLLCCKFSPCGRRLFLGATDGSVRAYHLAKNVWKEESTVYCNLTEVSFCDVAKKDSNDLILTSTYEFPSDSSLWKYSGRFEKQYGFREEHHVEFSKMSPLKMIGSQNDHDANIFDTETGDKILHFNSEHFPEPCCKTSPNKAAFDPTDNLVLSDRVLWDARSARVIHFFEAICPEFGVQFHPNGLELVNSSNVWDLRMFRLIRVETMFHQSRVKFTKVGDVMYGSVQYPFTQPTSVPLRPYTTLNASIFFRTVDAYDYSSLYNVDMTRVNVDLEMNELHLAAIQYEPMVKFQTRGSICDVFKTFTTTVCRLFEVGRVPD